MTLTTPPLDGATTSRSALAPPTPLAPLGGAVVESDRAPFYWSGVPGARRYTLQIASDRQFTHDVEEVNAGPSTEVLLERALPASGAPRFWRVRAETTEGPTRWSPYGRFVAGSDRDADAFRARQEAGRAEARHEAARRRAEEQAALDLVPYF